MELAEYCPKSARSINHEFIGYLLYGSRGEALLMQADEN